MTINIENIESIECRFAVHCPTPVGLNEDLHVVKEIVHTKDGNSYPNIRLIKDYKRPFYITKKAQRNHKQKKEWELIENLDKYTATQSKLIQTISKAIGEPYFKGDLRTLCSNPYIYGADILSTALIKQQYSKKFANGKQTKYSVAVFDTETDVLYDTGEIIMATLSFGSKVFTAIKASCLVGHHNPLKSISEKLNKYLSEYIIKRNIQHDVMIVESEAEIIIQCFKKAHEWKPDFVAIWNITFDVNKMIEALAKANIDPKDVLSDPSVPRDYRFFKFKQGPKQKVTASGKITPIKPAAQWHTVYCPSSFYFIDAMCAFKHIRIAEADRQSYSLDSILDDELGIRKLRFKEADKYTGIEWHQFMQEKYIIEYVIYNVFDCISMEELDEKTLDLSLTLPMLSMFSDFENFKSQPRRLVDNLHFYCLENKRVIATTSKDMTSEDDTDTLSLTGWIITLPAHLVADNGLRVIEEDPNIIGNVRVHIGDLDVSAAYPTNECVFNISRETTRKEICSIDGIPEITSRLQGINLSGGISNSAEFCQVMFGLPTFDKLAEHYKETKNII